MRKIRFLQLGHDNNTILTNLALVLSRTQTAYDFLFEDDIIDVSALSALPNGRFPTRVLEEAAMRHMRTEEYTEFPIAVTGLPLEDVLVSSADENLALLSTSDWEKFSRFPRIKGLQYLVAGALLDMHDITPVHYDTKRCPNDYCEELSDIDQGICKAELCSSCRRAVLEAIEKGRLTLLEATAIHRILDAVAERKMCFVLMPFRPRFAAAYDAIRKAVECSGFTARRADEIFETQGIVQLIYEQLGRAEVIVADLTERNPNVLYELGYAHALGKSTVLVTQKTDDVPFDLRHRQYVLYDPNELAGTLGVKIQAYLS